jgi:hypothetical protein
VSGGRSRAVTEKQIESHRQSLHSTPAVATV